MIASLVEPVSYDKAAALKVYLGVGGLVLALFAILAVWCVLWSAFQHLTTLRRGKR